VVPVATIGTEAVRRGWRIRPHRVRIRLGPPLRFGRVDAPSRALAAAATDRIWARVSLQWEWLGGQPAPDFDRAVAEVLRRGAEVPREVASHG
jgi:hypothetical protein